MTAETVQMKLRVSPEVRDEFHKFVVEKTGKKRGEVSRQAENALKEYMDNDRYDRVESKLDEVLARLPDENGSHTHTASSNEPLEKVEQIAAELATDEQQVGDDTLVQADDVQRAIETIAGTDDRTIEKYQRQLKRQGLAYEHPTSAVWTLDRPTWIEWTDSHVENNPTVSIGDVIEDYPLTHDDYIEAVTDAEVAAHA